MSFLEITRWVVGAVLGVIWLLFSGMSWAILIHNLNPARKNYVSPMPLIGGISGLLAFLIVPIPALRPWCWIPLIVDFGSIPIFVSWEWILLTRRLKRSRSEDQDAER